MARTTLCVTDLGTGFCYDSTTEKINTVGGGVDCADVINNGANSANVIQLPNVQDAAGNVTVLNVNGNIPLDSTGNVGYVTGGQLRVPGGAIRLKGTTYNLTPTQTVGATATTNTITFGIPTMPFASDLVITGRQIVATSYAAINSSHQIRMTTNIASTGPVLPILVSTRDVILGFGTYNADSAEMYVQSSIISIPANTPAFNVTANCNIQILGLGGTPSASGTSGIFTVVIKPKTETIT